MTLKSILWYNFFSQSKYQLLINGRKNIGNKNEENPKTFVDYSQAIDAVYENLEDYNPIKINVLIVLDDVIAHMKANKKLSPIVTENLTFHLLLYHNLISKCLKT